MTREVHGRIKQEMSGLKCCDLLLCSIVKLTNRDKIKTTMTGSNKKA